MLDEQAGTDPFWENAPKELTTEYVGLRDDAEGYYTIFDDLEVLIDDSRQDELHEKARERFADDPMRLAEIERRWKAIRRRREQMGVNLRGSLEACARAGIDMFRDPELRRTFCPTKEEYFELDESSGMLRPVPTSSPASTRSSTKERSSAKQIWFDAADFIQIALKSQWQDSVLRSSASPRPSTRPRASTVSSLSCRAVATPSSFA